MIKPIIRYRYHLKDTNSYIWMDPQDDYELVPDFENHIYLKVSSKKMNKGN